MIDFKNTQTFALNLSYKPFLLFVFAEELREKSNDKKSILQQEKSLAGALRQYAKQDLIEKEKDIAWELVAKERDLSNNFKQTTIFSLSEISKEEDLWNYQPKTELGKDLWKLKLEYIISGGRLSDDKEKKQYRRDR